MPAYIMSQDEIRHHGILGQRWGVRRFQNYDGSLKNGVKSTSDHDGYKVNSKNNKQSIKDAEKAAKIAKKEYKQKDKNFVKDMNKATKESDKAYTQEVRSLKKKLKSGQITKAEYRELKRNAIEKYGAMADKAQRKVSSDLNKAKESYNSAKNNVIERDAAYTKEVDKARSHLNKTEKLNRLIWNDSYVKQQAAKLMVDKGYDQKKAIKKVKNKAKVATALTLAVDAAIVVL